MYGKCGNPCPRLKMTECTENRDDLLQDFPLVNDKISEYTCKTCSAYKSQLNKALEKLETTRAIIGILQKEIPSIVNVELNELQSLQEQGTWIKQTSTRITDATPNQHTKGMKIPTLINGRLTHDRDRKPTAREKKDVKSPTRTRTSHKVKIVGDSYFRGIAPKIDQYLNTKFKVCSWIKPGATTKETVNTLGSNLKCLGTQDVIVVNGGMNDIDSKINQNHKVLAHMTQFIQDNVHSNVVIVNTPPRHDIESNSITDIEIQAVNRKLNKIAKAYNNVTIVDSNLRRECVTRHGLHRNKYGKERLSKLIAATNPLREQIVTCTIEPNKLNDSGTVNVEALNNRERKRNRRLPITRSDDFLWPTTIG